MDFVAYLVSKNIDNQKFASSDKALYEQWQQEYLQLNPKSFTAQKLFTINEIRRRYQLHIGAKPKEKPTVSQPADATTKAAAKPILNKPVVGHTEAPIPQKDVPATELSDAANSAHTSQDSAVAPQGSEPAKKQVAKPVFKRPVKDDVSSATIPLSTHTDQTNTDPADAPKKALAKPVFKRPNSTLSNENQQTETPATDNKEGDNTLQTSPQANTPKKSTAKPIFKRPENKTAEPDSAPALSTPAVNPQTSIPPLENNSSEAVDKKESPLPSKPMPKPVFKRPELNTEQSIKTDAAEQAPPMAAPEPAPAKKPMPKPVFKRPENKD